MINNLTDSGVFLSITPLKCFTYYLSSIMISLKSNFFHEKVTHENSKNSTFSVRIRSFNLRRCRRPAARLLSGRQRHPMVPCDGRHSFDLHLLGTVLLTDLINPIESKNNDRQTTPFQKTFHPVHGCISSDPSCPSGQLSIAEENTADHHDFRRVPERFIRQS